MSTHATRIPRRQFFHTLSLATAGAALAGSAGRAAPVAAGKLRLGYDNFAVRAMQWSAEELIDYAARQQLDTVFITDLKPFRTFEDAYLGELRRKAVDVGVQVLLGSWSICPTSKTFKKDWGTAEEHLALGIRMARALGSPVFRCVLGSREDRKTPGGIGARIEDTVRVLRACRSQAIDAGVKIAVENHAGDMQAWELVTLIEAAGKEYVGANIDAGNATWTLEDPLDHLEVLGPYVLSSSLRDSMVWEYADGAKVAWTAMGEGNVDLQTYFRRFAELCPTVAVNLETISGFSVDFPYWKPEFWEAWPKAPARGFARFVQLARTGKAVAPHRSANDAEEQAYQRGELERSLRYCKDVLGLGTR